MSKQKKPPADTAGVLSRARNADQPTAEVVPFRPRREAAIPDPDPDPDDQPPPSAA